MITLSTEAKTKLEAALARAQAENITLRESVDGVYFVNGKTDTYMVVIGKVEGQPVAECNCTAGRHGKICKHAALALADYKAKLEEKAAVKAYEALIPFPAPQVTFCGCGSELPLPGDTTCADCLLEAHRDLFGDAPVRRERVKEAM